MPDDVFPLCNSPVCGPAPLAGPRWTPPAHSHPPH